jgi:hypothetical protein
MDLSAATFPIPSTYSRIIDTVAYLQERDLGKPLRGTGLPEGILMPGDETHISGEQQLQILENGRRLFGSPDFGLQLFAQPQPSVHGALNDRYALNSGQKGMMSWQARIDSGCVKTR